MANCLAAPILCKFSYESRNVIRIFLKYWDLARQLHETVNLIFIAVASKVHANYIKLDDKVRKSLYFLTFYQSSSLPTCYLVTKC